MELDNDKCNINESIESIAAERHDTEHTDDPQDPVPQLDEVTSERSATNKVSDDAAPPVILWRSLMLQQ